MNEWYEYAFGNKTSWGEKSTYCFSNPTQDSSQAQQYLFSKATNASFPEREIRHWAETWGRVISYDQISSLPLLCDQTAEHLVYLHPEKDKAVKVVKPGGFGMSISISNKDASLQTGSLADYLLRCYLFNLVFGGDMKLEGVTIIKDDITYKEVPLLVMSQSWEWAETSDSPNPTSTEIKSYMHELGFEAGYRTHQWLRQHDRVYVADARPDNFVKTAIGVRAIDLIVNFF